MQRSVGVQCWVEAVSEYSGVLDWRPKRSASVSCCLGAIHIVPSVSVASSLSSHCIFFLIGISSTPRNTCIVLRLFMVPKFHPTRAFSLSKRWLEMLRDSGFQPLELHWSWMHLLTLSKSWSLLEIHFGSIVILHLSQECSTVTWRCPVLRVPAFALFQAFVAKSKRLFGKDSLDHFALPLKTRF